MNPAIPETDPLLQAAVTALTPAFLAQANGDATLARQAAQDVILSHHPASGADALLAAQAIAFSLAAIQASAQAAATPEASRIRSAATSLARSAERCRRALNTLAPSPSPLSPPQDWDHVWADAMAEVAQELGRSPNHVTNQPPISALVAAVSLGRLPNQR